MLCTTRLPLLLLAGLVVLLVAVALLVGLARAPPDPAIRVIERAAGAARDRRPLRRAPTCRPAPTTSSRRSRQHAQHDGRAARAVARQRARVPALDLARPAHAAHVDPRLRGGARRRHARRRRSRRTQAGRDRDRRRRRRRLERLVRDLLDLSRLDSRAVLAHAAAVRRDRDRARRRRGVRAAGARPRHRRSTRRRGRRAPGRARSRTRSRRSSRTSSRTR